MKQEQLRAQESRCLLAQVVTAMLQGRSDGRGGDGAPLAFAWPVISYLFRGRTAFGKIQINCSHDSVALLTCQSKRARQTPHWRTSVLMLLPLVCSAPEGCCWSMPSTFLAQTAVTSVCNMTSTLLWESMQNSRGGVCSAPPFIAVFSAQNFAP